MVFVSVLTGGLILQATVNRLEAIDGQHRVDLHQRLEGMITDVEDATKAADLDLNDTPSNDNDDE